MRWGGQWVLRALGAGLRNARAAPAARCPASASQAPQATELAGPWRHRSSRSAERTRGRCHSSSFQSTPKTPEREAADHQALLLKAEPKPKSNPLTASAQPHGPHQQVWVFFMDFRFLKMNYHLRNTSWKPIGSVGVWGWCWSTEETAPTQ